MAERSWKQAIIRVLQESEDPLHYTDITQQILERGYYQTDGATPAATVNAQIASAIKHEGASSPFVRVARGTFDLRDRAIPVTKLENPPKLTTHKDVLEPEVDGSVIHAFGMYWQRELVVWKNEPKLYGKQQIKSKPVDFGAQIGLYILYDNHRAIYVGRATDRPLGRRLYEHTLDRLSGRWNRFSWFGFHEVTPEGNLREPVTKISVMSIVNSLEALMIEALEPPQNRKRGDDFSAIEYIQEVDPEYKERELKATIRAIEQKLRSET